MQSETPKYFDDIGLAFQNILFSDHPELNKIQKVYNLIFHENGKSLVDPATLQTVAMNMSASASVEKSKPTQSTDLEKFHAQFNAIFKGQDGGDELKESLLQRHKKDTKLDLDAAFKDIALIQNMATELHKINPTNGRKEAIEIYKELATDYPSIMQEAMEQEANKIIANKKQITSDEEIARKLQRQESSLIEEENKNKTEQIKSDGEYAQALQKQFNLEPNSRQTSRSNSTSSSSTSSTISLNSTVSTTSSDSNTERSRVGIQNAKEMNKDSLLVRTRKAIVSGIKAILPTATRIAIFGLEQKDSDYLIKKFRNAKNPRLLKQAAENIREYHTDFGFKSENQHFVDVADKIVSKKEFNTKPPYSYIPDPNGGNKVDKVAATAELEAFMENLKQRKTKSLTADTTHLVPFTNVNKIGINYVSDNKTEGELDRNKKDIQGFLNKAKGDGKQNTEEQLKILEGVIIGRYPLTIHLIDPSPSATVERMMQDRLVLMQFGSYFQEKDTEFAQRWQDHNKLKEDFQKKLKEFVKGGMQNPEEFEKYMQDTSIKVAEMYKADVRMFPDNTKFGGDRNRLGKTKQEVLQKVDIHIKGDKDKGIKGIEDGKMHLSAALARAVTAIEGEKASLSTAPSTKVELQENKPKTFAQKFKEKLQTTIRTFP